MIAHTPAPCSAQTACSREQPLPHPSSCATPVWCLASVTVSARDAPLRLAMQRAPCWRVYDSDQTSCVRTMRPHAPIAPRVRRPLQQKGKPMTDSYQPPAEDRFTFGLWTVGNLGRDPFGEPVRGALTPVELVHLLAEAGAYGVNFHDTDLVPIAGTPAQRHAVVRQCQAAL